MPRYHHLKYDIEKHRRAWVIDRLSALRRQLRRDVSDQLKFDRKDAFLLATWNIRDFDSNKFGHGPRLTATGWFSKSMAMPARLVLMNLNEFIYID